MKALLLICATCWAICTEKIWSDYTLARENQEMLRQVLPILPQSIKPDGRL